MTCCAPAAASLLAANLPAAPSAHLVPALAQGGKLERAAESPEEQAARELCSVEGVGEATAIVLARTQELGGACHPGVDSLRSWASVSGGRRGVRAGCWRAWGGRQRGRAWLHAGQVLCSRMHPLKVPGFCSVVCVPTASWMPPRIPPSPADANAQALLSFLMGSEEVPESTRRWPAWQQRIAPRIVLALSGRWLGSGPEPSPKVGEAEGEEEEKGAEGGSELAAQQQQQQETGQQEHQEEEQQQRQQKQQQAEEQVQQQVHQAEQQAQQAQQQQDHGPPQAQAAPPEAKENRQTHNRKPPPAAPAAAAHAAPAAAAPAQPQRGQRQRKASSKLTGFLTAAEAEEAHGLAGEY